MFKTRKCGCGCGKETVEGARLIAGHSPRWGLPRDARARFWEKVERGGAEECWIWRGAIDAATGYGRFHGASSAHRFAYETAHGLIPSGLQLDHLCRTRACVNPNHLEPVTQRENILRGTTPAAMNAIKTHCKRGHPLSGGNLLVVSRGRRCKRCQDDYNARQGAA